MLNDPFPLYGLVTVSGSSLATTVYLKNITTGVSYSTESDSEGFYLYDLMDVCSISDYIKVWATQNTKFDQETFAVDISGPAQEINLTLANSISKVRLTISQELPYVASNTHEEYYNVREIINE